MNVRELKRRLLPYSGYMKPAEDGADAGGGQAAADGGDTATEDRGDDFTPSADADDGSPGDGGGNALDASATGEPEGGDTTEGKHAPAGIPKGRFNEVNQQRKEALALLAAANEEIARLKGGSQGQKEDAPPAPAPAPAAGAKGQAPAPVAGGGAFDVEAQEEAYIAALLEGDSKGAVAIRKQINAHLQEEASARATQVLTQQQAAQLLKTTAKSVSDAYPWLNEPAGEEVLDLILAARDRKIAQGMPAHLALVDAANTIAPKFAPADDGTPSRVSGKETPAKDLRPAAAIARGAADSTAQPPALQVGIGERATASRVNVAQLTEEQFEALTPAEKKRLRGD